MSDISIHRGKNRLSMGQLQEYLTALFGVENVGVLLGAGASLSAGGRTMRDTWDDLVQNQSDTVGWLAERGLISTIDTIPNLEDMLSRMALQAAAERMAGGRTSDSQFEKHFDVIYKALIRSSILCERWWDEPETILASSIAEGVAGDPRGDIKAHRTLLRHLIGSRRPGQAAPWVFTTNYDLAIEWAAETIGAHVVNGFSGLHQRRFDSSNFDLAFRNTLVRGEGALGTYNVYLAKLHGSLTWLNGGSIDKIREVPANAHTNPLKRPSPRELLMILPGAAKYLDTVGFVYGELMRRLADFLGRRQTCLVINGYSFGDQHINRVLATALHNPTLHIIVYLYGPLENQAEWSPFLRELWDQELSQVTFVVGQPVTFQWLVGNLPQRTIQDLDEERMLTAIRLLMDKAAPIIEPLDGQDEETTGTDAARNPHGQEVRP